MSINRDKIAIEEQFNTFRGISIIQIILGCALIAILFWLTLIIEGRIPHRFLENRGYTHIIFYSRIIIGFFALLMIPSLIYLYKIATLKFTKYNSAEEGLQQVFRHFKRVNLSLTVLWSGVVILLTVAAIKLIS